MIRSPSASASSSARWASARASSPSWGQTEFPLSLGGFGGLMDGLLTSANRRGFLGVGKHDSCTLHLGAGSPDGLGSYLRCLVGLLIGSLN